MEKLYASKTFLKMVGGSRAVDLWGPSVYQGGEGQSLKLRTKAAVFKSMLVNWGAKHVNWEGAGSFGPS